MKLVNYKCFRREFYITLSNDVCIFRRFEMENKIDYSVLKDYVQDLYFIAITNLDLKTIARLKIQITVKSFIKAEIQGSNIRINFETTKTIKGSRQLVNFLLVK